MSTPAPGNPGNFTVRGVHISNAGGKAGKGKGKAIPAMGYTPNPGATPTKPVTPKPQPKPQGGRKRGR